MLTSKLGILPKIMTFFVLGLILPCVKPVINYPLNNRRGSAPAAPVPCLPCRSVLLILLWPRIGRSIILKSPIRNGSPKWSPCGPKGFANLLCLRCKKPMRKNSGNDCGNLIKSSKCWTTLRRPVNIGSLANSGALRAPQGWVAMEEITE